MCVCVWLFKIISLILCCTPEGEIFEGFCNGCNLCISKAKSSRCKVGVASTYTLHNLGISPQ